MSALSMSKTTLEVKQTGLTWSTGKYTKEGDEIREIISHIVIFAKKRFSSLSESEKTYLKTMQEGYKEEYDDWIMDKKSLHPNSIDLWCALFKNYTLTLEKLDAALKFISESSSCIIMDNSQCTDNIGAISYVHYMDISASDTNAINLSGGKLNYLKLEKTTTKIKVLVVAQFAFDMMNLKRLNFNKPQNWRAITTNKSGGCQIV